MLTELNTRSNDGLTVTLYADFTVKDSQGNPLIVLDVSDEKSSTEGRVTVAPENASDAFSHPFCYLSSDAAISAQVSAQVLA